ncbi:MAG TPA: hypothetical protein VK783_14010 [Bacteroidia bacterium]|jgi:hypothetical protein|nr:hypothetical protein [Bacteroidia bacterium]
MKILIAVLIIILPTCCKTVKKTDNGTEKEVNQFPKTLNYGSFKIKTPSNWNKIKLEGIDSFVGGLTNGIDTLVFDFGLYSNSLTDDFEKQLYADDTINGKVGYITKPKIKGEGFLGVYFENIDGDKFNLCGRDPLNEDTIMLIFQNIIFKSSDTTKNSQSLKFASRDFAKVRNEDIKKWLESQSTPAKPTK